jgi:5'-nucleotidase
MRQSTAQAAAPSRAGHWMQTYLGGAYWPCDPRPEEVHIVDIAHHLSMLCRYTGACKGFYSVAEHSILVSYRVPQEHALTGLLHDATEAYVADVNRPVKHGPGMKGYRAIEMLNWLAIAEKFGLPKKMPAAVERVDNEMLFHEQAALMQPAPEGMDWGMGLPQPAEVRPDLISCLPWWLAKQVFLRRYIELARMR